jgi:hypothetical protein
MRSTRDKIQDKLWSDRTISKAQTSLRRALSNIRKTSPELEGAIKSDRNTVWLVPEFWKIESSKISAEAEFLEDVRVKDPEFEDWRREHSAQCPDFQIHKKVEQNHHSVDDLSFLIQQLGQPSSDLEATARHHFCNVLQTRLSALGSVQIVETETDFMDVKLEQGVVEVRSSLGDDGWFVMLRVLQGKHRRCLWSGHVTVPLEMPWLAGSPEIGALISRAFSAIVDTYETLHGSKAPPKLRLQKASELLFTGNARKIELSESMLETLGDSGLTKAWRAFALLTHALEFRKFGLDEMVECTELAEDAASEARGDATVQALAAIVSMKVQHDLDFGVHLAKRAIALDEHNPYALNAMAQAHFFNGCSNKVYMTARKGQHAAAGLANGHYWDMQACLAALGVGDIERALRHAQSSFLAWPKCRPPLRYLVALNLIRKDPQAAKEHAKKLCRLEPGFELAQLSDPSYPVETLRHLNLVDELVYA